MLGDAIEYPARGEDAPTTILVGGLLPILAVLLAVVGVALSVVVIGLAVLPLAVVSVIVLCGYYVAVLRAVTAGETEPPRFRNWRRLFADGLRFIGITVAYAMPALVLLGVFLAVIAVAGSVAGNRLAAVAVTLGAVLSGGLALVAVFGYAYLRPLALANVAREDRLQAAFEVDTLRDAGFSKVYAVAWMLGVLVWLVGSALEGALSIVLIGVFLGFYADIARWYLYGCGFSVALEGTTPPDRADAEAASGSPVETEPTLPTAAVPVIEEPEAFSARTRAVDHERGWPDWETDQEK